jgi:UDP-N-acetylmuramoyl-L-alanyl-D-glutamate--2,6-diaminopimelate ligase
LARVIAALAPADVVNGADTDVRELEYDSRAVRPGTLFVCVPGERADGHDHAAEAVARGASALVVERPLPLPVPQLVVPDARRAMADLAAFFYGDPRAGCRRCHGHEREAIIAVSPVHDARRRAVSRPLGTIESRVGGERRPASARRRRPSTFQRRPERC